MTDSTIKNALKSYSPVRNAEAKCTQHPARSTQPSGRTVGLALVALIVGHFGIFRDVGGLLSYMYTVPGTEQISCKFAYLEEET